MEAKALRLLDRLRRSCSRREYCTSDVRKKALAGMEGDVHAAEEIVASLLEDRYVDDLRYATAYAREKSAVNGWGEVKIRHMLSAKGI
ncbi:MAG: RecX family transcriptional regulator, partial [Bacteroidales bacterium]|nr:RecX family transcriptional regulator [Bacteroidales bacterium]